MIKNTELKKKNEIQDNSSDMDIIQTSRYNEEPELITLACKNCGAALELVDKTHAKCLYCGRKFFIDRANGVSIVMTVDYGDSRKTRDMVRSIKRMLIAFGLVAAGMVLVILLCNYC